MIDTAGQETRGKVAKVSASSLVLLVRDKTSGLDTDKGAKRSFDEDAVAEILKSDSSGGRAHESISLSHGRFKTCNGL